MPRATKKAKKLVIEEGYYILLTDGESGTVVGFGPDSDVKVAKWFRKLVKDERYAATEDFAEVRALDESDEIIIESVVPVSQVLDAYKDDGASE